jgi:hypothetical protein
MGGAGAVLYRPDVNGDAEPRNGDVSKNPTGKADKNGVSPGRPAMAQPDGEAAKGVEKGVDDEDVDVDGSGSGGMATGGTAVTGRRLSGRMAAAGPDATDLPVDDDGVECPLPVPPAPLMGTNGGKGLLDGTTVGACDTLLAVGTVTDSGASAVGL